MNACLIKEWILSDCMLWFWLPLSWIGSTLFWPHRIWSELIALITGRFSPCACESCRRNLHILCAALPCLITKASFTGRISTFLCKVFPMGICGREKTRKGGWRISSSVTPKWFSCSYLRNHLLKGDQHVPISPPQVRLQAVFSRH